MTDISSLHFIGSTNESNHEVPSITEEEAAFLGWAVTESKFPDTKYRINIFPTFEKDDIYHVVTLADGFNLCSPTQTFIVLSLPQKHIKGFAPIMVFEKDEIEEANKLCNKLNKALLPFTKYERIKTIISRQNNI